MSKRHHEADDAVLPTPERGRQGDVERFERPISDDEGRVSRPYRAIDLLEGMFRRGAITATMRAAGYEFQEIFRLAHLDQLRAQDLTKPVVDGGRRQYGEGLRVENAKDKLWRAVCALGGLASPGGSCAWNVLGLEQSPKEWAIVRGWSGRMVNEGAYGVLITVVGALEKHFEGDK